MAHHVLDDVDIDAHVHQMGGEAVAEGMNPSALRDPGPLFGQVKGFLGRIDRHGAVFGAAEKEVLIGAVKGVVGAQFPQQAFGKQRVAILLPLALLNPDHPAAAFDMSRL